MVRNLERIQKQLTIISIFAGIVQISGIAVLPSIESENQSQLIWFLMSFPVLLVLLFFVTINSYIRFYFKSQVQQNVPKSGKDVKPAARYEIEQKTRDEIKLAVQPKIVADSQRYVKKASKVEAEVTGEKYRRIKKSSGNSITWK